jgi:Kelch motif
MPDDGNAPDQEAMGVQDLVQQTGDQAGQVPQLSQEIAAAAGEVRRQGTSARERAAAVKWIARPPLRQARGGLGVAKAGRQILAIGGFEVVDEVQAVFFDVVEARRVRGSGRWRDLAPLPTARGNLATAEVGGLVYAIGGLDDVNDLDVVETFDPRTGRWATSVPLPQPRAFPERRAWVGCCMWPVARSNWLLTPSRSPTR